MRLGPNKLHAIQKSGWDIGSQVLEKLSFVDGKIYVIGNSMARCKTERGFHPVLQPNIPIAIVEGKDNIHEINIQREAEKNKLNIEGLMKAVLQEAFN